MADNDIPGTGKVHHENFNLGKILQSMTDSPEFDFILLCGPIFNQNGWPVGQIFTIHFMVLDTALILSFTPTTTLHVSRLWQTFFAMCESV